jgi:hypothetical protein
VTESRVKHYSIQAKQADSDWIRRFVIFGGKGRFPSFKWVFEWLQMAVGKIAERLLPHSGKGSSGSISPVSLIGQSWSFASFGGTAKFAFRLLKHCPT